MTHTHIPDTYPTLTTLSHNDTYTFHFSLHTPCMTPMPLLCLHYLFCLKSLSLSSPLTGILSILSTSSLNTAAPLQPSSQPGAFLNSLFPLNSLACLFISSAHGHPGLCTMAGSAGGSGAAAETNPDLVLVLRLSCLLRRGVGVHWIS